MTIQIGNTFGKWTVCGPITKDTKSHRAWPCRCECGFEKEVREYNLLTGTSTKCRTCHLKDLGRVGWKGGRRKGPGGYMDLRIPDHPRARSNGYVLEHIVVMETILGRALLPEENVHHKNGVKDDNRPENLELWSRSHPPGQRVSDKLAWAKEIVQLYDHLSK